MKTTSSNISVAMFLVGGVQRNVKCISVYNIQSNVFWQVCLQNMRIVNSCVTFVFVSLWYSVTQHIKLADRMKSWTAWNNSVPILIRPRQAVRPGVFWTSDGDL